MSRLLGLLLLAMLLTVGCSPVEDAPLEYSEPTATPRASSTPTRLAATDAVRLIELYRTTSSKKLVVWWMRDKEREVDCWIVVSAGVEAGAGITCLKLP